MLNGRWDGCSRSPRVTTSWSASTDPRPHWRRRATAFARKLALPLHLVIGATGAGAVERWILGSTAQRVVDQAHCPVAVWPGDPGHPPPDDRPIVVGCDGSPLSAGATELAFAWAQLFAVPVVPVRTWTDSAAAGDSVPTAMQVFGPTAMTADRETIARAEAGSLSTIVAPYREKFPGVAVEERSRRGSAVRELLRALDEGQMLIVGHKGRGRLHGALLGSTTQNLLHRAQRPQICQIS